MLLGHRYYDSSTGRFLSRDPILDGYNWFAYCDNDPVNAVDPTGLDFIVNFSLGVHISLGPWNLDYSLGGAISIGSGGVHGGFYDSYAYGAGPDGLGGLGIGFAAGPSVGIGFGSLDGFGGSGRSLSADLPPIPPIPVSISGSYNWSDDYHGISGGLWPGWIVGAHLNKTTTHFLTRF